MRTLSLRRKRFSSAAADAIDRTTAIHRRAGTNTDARRADADTGNADDRRAATTRLPPPASAAPRSPAARRPSCSKPPRPGPNPHRPARTTPRPRTPPSVRPALSHPVFFNICHLSRFGVQPCDVPIGHRSRRGTYMVQSSARQHPMKMVWACAPRFAARLSDAMNMAWTASATSTSFRALSTLTSSSKGDP